MRNCRQRSVLYETWCQTCLLIGKNEEREAGTEGKEAGEKKKRKREKEEGEKGQLYHYIGETSRSTFERGIEHQKDLEYRRTRSHLLRHCEEVHPQENPDSISFGMRQISSHKTAKGGGTYRVL